MGGTSYGWLLAHWEEAPNTMGMLIYRVGLPKVGFWKWHIKCYHTTHTIVQKIRMIHLMSHTRQSLLSKTSTDVPWPIIAKLCYLLGHNQDQWPWPRAYWYLSVQKGYGPFFTITYMHHRKQRNVEKSQEKIVWGHLKTSVRWWNSGEVDRLKRTPKSVVFFKLDSQLDFHVVTLRCKHFQSSCAITRYDLIRTILFQRYT